MKVGVPEVHHRLQLHHGITLEDSRNPDVKIDSEWELYNLEADPREINNIYGHAGYAKAQAEILAKLD